MRMFPALFALPFWSRSAIAAAPHSGMVRRDGFELSDVALFVVAVAGIWIARRAIRARFRKHRQSTRD